MNDIYVTTVTPTVDTNIYASGDQLGDLKTIVGAVKTEGGTAKLMSLALVDKIKQKSALDVLIFNAAPTLTSVDNGALSISDAEMAAKYLGRVSIAAADYTDTSVNSDATKMNLNLMVKAASGSCDLYMILQSKGTPTYTSASDLVLKLGFNQ